MHRPLGKFLASFLCVTGMAWSRPVVAADTARPNIILVMVDDFGYECVTANGGQSYKTPVLDRLASSGIRFEQCHVQPLCTPTRVQLMTGKYNIRNYLNFGTLPRTEVTFGNLLKGAGYATGICGKWQLGRESDSPQHFGFDESCLWQQTRRPPRYANPGLEYNGVEKDFKNGEYGPTLVNDFALEFIERHQDEPFLLYYPMILTHSPYQPTPDSPNWDPTIDNENKNNDAKHFADMIAYMDKMIGRVDAKLDELKIRDNTVLMVIGDNGTGKGTMSRFKRTDYPGGKGKTTQAGTHVPFIASWPGKVTSARVSGDLISSADFLPTLCELAGVTIPTGSDGVSFLPELLDQSGTHRDWLYSWYSPRQAADMTVKEWAFDEDFKLYRTGEFFNLSVDPLEQHPLNVKRLDDTAKTGFTKLTKVLDQFSNARPKELDRTFQDAKGDDGGKEKKKSKIRSRKLPKEATR